MKSKRSSKLSNAYALNWINLIVSANCLKVDCKIIFFGRLVYDSWTVNCQSSCRHPKCLRSTRHVPFHTFAKYPKLHFEIQNLFDLCLLSKLFFSNTTNRIAVIQCSFEIPRSGICRVLKLADFKLIFNLTCTLNFLLLPFQLYFSQKLKLGSQSLSSCSEAPNFDNLDSRLRFILYAGSVFT